MFLIWSVWGPGARLTSRSARVEWRPAGIEPATDGNEHRVRVGQTVPKDGQDAAQVGQPEGVAVCPICKGRPEPGRNESKAGRGASTTGAQRAETAGHPDNDVQVVIDSWAALPEPVRLAIIGAVRAFPVPAQNGSSQGSCLKEVLVCSK